MNILLIDNGTTLLPKLKELIPGTEIVSTWKDFTSADVEAADLIVLSGSSRMPLVGNEKEFEKELELIRGTQTPLIGICFGTELIIRAFEGTLKELSERHHGVRSIEILVPAPKSIKVYENHRWIVDVLPKEFEVLAVSDAGPEMIQHTTRPIYGLQFHPENLVTETEGDTVFNEILDHIVANIDSSIS